MKYQLIFPSNQYWLKLVKALNLREQIDEKIVKINKIKTFAIASKWTFNDDKWL